MTDAATTNGLAQAALGYAARDWRVVPLYPCYRMGLALAARIAGSQRANTPG